MGISAASLPKQTFICQLPFLGATTEKDIRWDSNELASQSYV